MKRTILTLGGLLAATLFTLGLATAPAIGDDDRGERYEREYDDDDHHEWGWRRFFGGPGFNRRLDVAPVDNPMYDAECGACHFPYQPGLLPARSWARLMRGLEDHFGESAELDAEPARRLTDYLLANAADRAEHRRSRAIAGSLGDAQAPLRISETRYFQRKHHEIPPRLVTGNDQVGSWSNCETCHTEAATGSYNEHQVTIPGIGRWDD